MKAEIPQSRSIWIILRWFAAFVALNVGTFLMLRLVWVYSSFADDVEFLRFKQAYLHLTIWKTAFYVHVFASVLTLLAGFTQFSAEFLNNHRRLHRILGYVYVVNVLAINCPAGMVMAIYANGGLSSKLAFIILDSLWFIFTLKAVLAAKRGNFSAHRDFMIRSYALTLSALSLRTWKVALSSFTDLSPEVIYMMDAWLGFVPNLLVAEWLIARSRTKKLATKSAHHRGGDSNHKHSATKGE